MKLSVSLFAVLALLAIAFGLTAAGLEVVFVGLLYVAFFVFVIGVIYRVTHWASSPVPFRIPTTSGQQKSLPWIKPAHLDNPSTKLGVVGRMLLEVLFFRSLLRNTKARVDPDGPRVSYASSEWLWVFALLFHWGFFIVFFRHFLRFFIGFTEEPWLLGAVESVDGFLQIGSPPILITGWLLLGGVTLLLLRRLMSPQVRYVSLAADYFPLFLILGIAATGILMRHLVRTDVASVKELMLGIVSFSPEIPEGIHWMFYAHLLMVITLALYFPFSKLMHMFGVFLSPTRNMANNNRAKRHINPWNPDVEVHTYEHYEEMFHKKLKQAGIPMDKVYEE